MSESECSRHQLERKPRIQKKTSISTNIYWEFRVIGISHDRDVAQEEKYAPYNSNDDIWLLSTTHNMSPAACGVVNMCV